MMRIYMSMYIRLLGPMMIKKNRGLNKPNLDYPYLSLPDIDEKEIDYEQDNIQRNEKV